MDLEIIKIVAQNMSQEEFIKFSFELAQYYKNNQHLVSKASALMERSFSNTLPSLSFEERTNIIKRANEKIDISASLEYDVGNLKIERKPYGEINFDSKNNDYFFLGKNKMYKVDRIQKFSDMIYFYFDEENQQTGFFLITNNEKIYWKPKSSVDKE